MESLICLFCLLAKIPSPSLGEQLVADKIVSTFQSLNIDTRQDRYGNVYAYIPPTDDKKSSILLSAHMDVVGDDSPVNIVYSSDGKYIETDKREKYITIMVNSPTKPLESKEITNISKQIDRFWHIGVIGRHSTKHRIRPMCILTSLLVMLTQIVTPSIRIYGIILNKVLALHRRSKIDCCNNKKCKHRQYMRINLLKIILHFL